MKKRACSRTWEAEAIGDGRLDPTARASFERHAANCAECGENLQALAQIIHALRELPQYESQAIDRRRGRIALIQQANSYLMRGRKRPWRVWAFASIAVSTLALTILASRWRPFGAVPAVVAPTFEILDVGHARWTTTDRAGATRVALSEGTASVHVEHLTDKQRFVVDLPDGNIEVRGTRFQVSVADRRTKRVDVREGAVALRLLGEREVVLLAGEQWSAPPQVAPLAIVASSAPSVFPSPDAIEPPLRLVAPARAPVTRAAVQSLASLEDAAPHVDKEPAGDGFAESIRAFDSSDYAGADHLLAAFVRDHPTDPRSEDAAFLRALSHERMGDASGAARLARDYLQRYPQALRRKEAQRFLESGGPSRP